MKINQNFPYKQFADIISVNTEFIKDFKHSKLTRTARKGLAIVTSMDSQISRLAVVGNQVGDAKILRNACARVIDDNLSNLVLASSLLGVSRVLVIRRS